MRNEIQNSNSLFPNKKETTMKMTTVTKASVLAATLGFAFLLPATARAQSDVMPDSFAFSSEEATATQPVQSAGVQKANADFEGKFSLPYGVLCAGKSLKPGQYLFSVKSEGSARVVAIRGGGENVRVHVREVRANLHGTTKSALLLRKSRDGRSLAGLYVEGLSSTLYLDTNTTGSDAGMERLPI
jgi:hypothetical protein